MTLANDIAEREDEMVLMRRRERIYQQRLSSKEKAHEQEVMVRRVLCKRLEEILVEKMDILERHEFEKDGKGLPYIIIYDFS